MTGQRSVTPHTHTLYDWTAVSYTTHTHTGQSDWPTCSGQTHTVRLDSGQLHHTHCMTGQLHHTHTHCMMEQCGRYWAIRLADLQWTNTHCTTGQRSVTPHTHTLYDWTAVSYTTHTHTV